MASGQLWGKSYSVLVNRPIGPSTISRFLEKKSFIVEAIGQWHFEWNRVNATYWWLAHGVSDLDGFPLKCGIDRFDNPVVTDLYSFYWAVGLGSGIIVSAEST